MIHFEALLPGMRFFLPGLQSPADAERAVLRAGYHAHLDPRTRERSLAKRLSTAGHYPRYHVYLEQTGDGVSANLHLDQKQPSYGAGHAHSGEYDGPLIERERDRILGLIKPV